MYRRVVMQQRSMQEVVRDAADAKYKRSMTMEIIRTVFGLMGLIFGCIGLVALLLMLDMVLQ